MKLSNRIYNSRLRNKPEDLQKVLTGANQDIKDVTALLLKFDRYRSDFMYKTKNEIRRATDGQAQKQEGILGKKPSNVKSVAELMMQDSDVAVYEDSNVALPEQAEFNIRGRVIKVLSKKEKEQQEKR